MFRRVFGVFLFASLASPTLLGCGSALGSHLSQSDDQQTIPDEFSLSYRDDHPMWGGQQITLNGEGAMTLLRLRPGNDVEADPERHSVERSEVLRVVSLLSELEAWKQQVADETGRLDSARTILSIRVGSDQSEVWEWTADLEATRRLVQVRSLLTTLLHERTVNAGSSAPESGLPAE